MCIFVFFVSQGVRLKVVHEYCNFSDLGSALVKLELVDPL